MTEPGLRGQEKLVDDAHETVLQISKKQNRDKQMNFSTYDKSIVSGTLSIIL